MAGFSVLTALAKSDDPEKPQPNYAFKHPSGWEYLNTDHSSLPYFFATKYVQAQDTNSIKDALTGPGKDLTAVLVCAPRPG